MKFVLSKLAIGVALISCVSSAFALEINRHTLQLNQDQYVKYEGSNENFKQGFPTGFGSALAFKEVRDNGDIVFLGLTDRGPNGDAPLASINGKTLSGKFFPTPKFNPLVGVLVLSKDGKFTVEHTISLKNKDGSLITGLPLPQGKVGYTGEYALGEDFSILPYDENGLDPEGLAIDKDGNMWISDEYGPFLMKFSQDGTLLEKYAPGKGLPEILKYRTPNRGAEGLTITPNGTIVVAEQSVLNLKHGDKKSGKTASFCRIVFFNPKTHETKTYGYPIDVDSYKKPGNAKLGDMIAINDHEVLIIEQAKNKHKKMQNLIYRVDFSGADDLSNAQKDGLEPEFFKDAAGFKLAKKSLLIDLREHGYKAEKAEGLTILPDRQTIAVINDNDFGVAIDLQDPENKKAEVTDYIYHEDGTFTLDGKSAKPSIKLVHNSDDEKDTDLFLIKLDEKLN